MIILFVFALHSPKHYLAVDVSTNGTSVTHTAFRDSSTTFISSNSTDPRDEKISRGENLLFHIPLQRPLK